MDIFYLYREIAYESRIIFQLQGSSSIVIGTLVPIYYSIGNTLAIESYRQFVVEFHIQK